MSSRKFNFYRKEIPTCCDCLIKDDVPNIKEVLRMYMIQFKKYILDGSEKSDIFELVFGLLNGTVGLNGVNCVLDHIDWTGIILTKIML